MKENNTKQLDEKYEALKLKSVIDTRLFFNTSSPPKDLFGSVKETCMILDAYSSGRFIPIFPR